MSIEGWQKLACECGSQNFTPISSLSYHPSQGTTSKQDGWQCTGCGKRAPMAALVDRAKKLTLEKKLREIEAQL